MRLTRQDRSRDNNRGTQRDATDGKFKTNADVQAKFRGKVSEDRDLQRGVTVKRSDGYRWDFGQ